MKEYRPVPLDEAPQSLKDLDTQIKDVSIYIQLAALGQFPGVHAEHVVKMKAFMTSIREQLIDAHDKDDFVKEKHEALAKAAESAKAGA